MKIILYLLIICMVVFFIDQILYNFKNYLKKHDVSWYKPKYRIIPYRTNFRYNFYGDIKSYEENYLICKYLPHVYKKYLYYHEYNLCVKKMEWRDEITNATTFNSKEKAQLLLGDMIKNPNNYTLEK